MSGGIRVRRAAIAAAGSTLLALGFHLAAGGAAPGLLGVLAPAVLAWFVGVTTMRARPRAVPLLAATATAQFAFHPLFSAGVALGGAHAHDADPSAWSGAAAGHAATHAGGSMWLAHALAAVLSAAVIHRGELLAALARRLGARLLAALGPAAPTASAGRRLPVPAAPRRPRPRPFLLAAPGRGPPAPVTP